MPNGTEICAQRVPADPRSGAKAEEAKAAGADFVGEYELVAAKSTVDDGFDRCCSTRHDGNRVGRLGRVLGPWR